MNLVVYSPSARVALDIGIAATLSGAEVDLQPTVQEFSTRLYRQPEAIGLYYQEGWVGSIEVAHALREASVLNLLFCVISHLEIDPSRQAGARARILNAGADDVQSWPVDPKEIATRLHALQRRTRPPEKLIVIPPSALFDPEAQKVYADGLIVHLTRKETDLLHLLATRPGACVSKSACMLALYGGQDEAQPKIIDVFLCKLRKKLEPICGDRDPIRTIWGRGYCFDAGLAA